MSITLEPRPEPEDQLTKFQIHNLKAMTGSRWCFDSYPEFGTLNMTIHGIHPQAYYDDVSSSAPGALTAHAVLTAPLDSTISDPQAALFDCANAAYWHMYKHHRGNMQCTTPIQCPHRSLPRGSDGEEQFLALTFEPLANSDYDAEASSAEALPSIQAYWSRMRELYEPLHFSDSSSDASEVEQQQGPCDVEMSDLEIDAECGAGQAVDAERMQLTEAALHAQTMQTQSRAQLAGPDAVSGTASVVGAQLGQPPRDGPAPDEIGPTAARGDTDHGLVRFLSIVSAL